MNKKVNEFFKLWGKYLLRFSWWIMIVLFIISMIFLFVMVMVALGGFILGTIGQWIFGIIAGIIIFTGFFSADRIWG